MEIAGAAEYVLGMRMGNESGVVGIDETSIGERDLRSLALAHIRALWGNSQLVQTSKLRIQVGEATAVQVSGPP